MGKLLSVFGGVIALSPWRSELSTRLWESSGDDDKLWHLGFNRIDGLNEQLVAGREDTRISSGRLYWENTLGFFDVEGATVPPPSASSPESSTRRRGAGPSTPTPTSSTSTSGTEATTLRPGRSRTSSRPRSVLRSGRCAKEAS
jgi:hypothetical protein